MVEGVVTVLRYKHGVSAVHRLAAIEGKVRKSVASKVQVEVEATIRLLQKQLDYSALAQGVLPHV